MHLVNLCVEQLYFYIPSLESSASLYSGHLCCPAFPSLCGPLFHLLLHSYYISQFIMPQRHTEAKAMTLVPASRASPRVDVKLNWQEGSAASLWPFKRSQNKKREKGRKRSQGMFLQSCTLFFFTPHPSPPSGTQLLAMLQGCFLKWSCKCDTQAQIQPEVKQHQILRVNMGCGVTSCNLYQSCRHGCLIRTWFRTRLGVGWTSGNKNEARNPTGWTTTRTFCICFVNHS